MYVHGNMDTILTYSDARQSAGMVGVLVQTVMKYLDVVEAHAMTLN